MKEKKILPIIAGLVTSFIFGFSFLFTKEALDTINPFDLLTFRFGTAALALIILRCIGIIRIDYKGKNVRALLILALFQPSFYFIFETLGIQKTTTSEAGVMMALIPIVVTCLAAIFLKEIPSKPQVFSISISVLGVILVVLMKSTDGSGSFIGLLLLLCGVLCASILNILSRKLSMSFKPVEITFFMMCTGAVFFGGISFISHLVKGNVEEMFLSLKEPKVMIAIFYLGILSSVVAFFLTNYNLSKLEASRAVIFSNLITVVSIVAGVLIRKEPFGIYQFIGTGMILIGVWGTNYYGEKKHQLPTNKDIRNH
ncbi:DMT family transporter [Inediibacterium massiliense]|uniref:DMT family transporter n=1 Tax=Inediibacterium massiliense TaxID=1658111 RepID=UPI0006B626EF|nr:DMT family transporter [Inediibacterium massiliense]